MEKPRPTFLAKPVLSCSLPSPLLGVLSMCVSVSLFKFIFFFMGTQSCWAYPNYLILAPFHLWRPSLFPNKVTFTGTRVKTSTYVYGEDMIQQVNSCFQGKVKTAKGMWRWTANGDNIFFQGPCWWWGRESGYQLHTYELSTTIQCYTIIQLIQCTMNRSRIS